MTVDGVDDALDQVVDAIWGVCEGDHRNDDVAVSHFDIDVGCQKIGLN